ncbi:NAD(P)-binding protein [Streptomyces sp. NPDC006544]|uniref:NAD(P)-binding protein n=1 Tax=Streptomyces sp. NPDC006544 TaxID=3154583 RepID=UPI0033BC04D5
MPRLGRVFTRPSRLPRAPPTGAGRGSWGPWHQWKSFGWPRCVFTSGDHGSDRHDGRRVVIPTPAGGDGRDVRVVVVGAAFSGLGAAIRLRRAGFGDVLVLEKASQLGGTWRENTTRAAPATCPPRSTVTPARRTRPGAACSPDSRRSTRTSPPRRNRTDSPMSCATAWRSTQHAGTRPLGAGSWRPATGPCSAAVLVMATGPWHIPRQLEVPGLEGSMGQCSTPPAGTSASTWPGSG